ncbi:metacaspase-1 [[Candida] railenensis]|uniref:Metacaspase-1 n=1 Tax=[Candida] railenensis TaxID=45579 RepID=A0A9P0VXX5_9ASCO|nr:metacaspase-1 [[Candida] railenensis]
MYPGSGNNSYGGYSRPSGPPPSQYQQSGNGGYGRPQGAPPPQSYQPQQQYSRPAAPPASTSSNYHGNTQDGNYNDPNSNTHQYQQYSRPSGPPPPSVPQSFGQNTGMTYQYSNCTGRRKALLVGINYIGSSNALRGCINDVKNMSQFLNQRFGYQYDDMVILTDDQREMARIPTRENILRAMQWLVKDARPNDSLVFHYSGHGGVTEDLDGDEESGFDDVIYPLDFQQNGHIVDDIMHDIMVKPLPAGCRLTALFDSCHSGTALDLPYVYSTKGVVKEPNLLKDAGGDALQAFLSYERGNIGGAISSLGGIFKKVSRSGSTNRDQVITIKASPADVISISGCKDDQTSADATENGQNTGAMSWSFIKTITEYPNQSYLSLLNNMRTLLSGKYSQKPQLSSSHPQDMNLQFLM